MFNVQQVVKFAEMTQEVHVTRPNPVKLDLGFTPGRRQANKVAALTRDIYTHARLFAHVSTNFIILSDIQARKEQIGEGRPTRSGRVEY